MQLSYGVLQLRMYLTGKHVVLYLGRDLTSTTQALICVPFLHYVRSRSQRALLHRYFVCTYKLYSCAYISLC